MLKGCLAMEGRIWGRDQPAPPSVFSRPPPCLPHFPRRVRALSAAGAGSCFVVRRPPPRPRS